MASFTHAWVDPRVALLVGGRGDAQLAAVERGERALDGVACSPGSASSLRSAKAASTRGRSVLRGSSEPLAIEAPSRPLSTGSRPLVKA